LIGLLDISGHTKGVVSSMRQSHVVNNNAPSFFYRIWLLHLQIRKVPTQSWW